MASSVVTTSQSDEECTLTGTPSGSATHEEGASGSLGVSWSEEASGSAEVTAPVTAAQSASSDEVNSSESTPGSPSHALTLVTDQPNWWCVDGQYQVYSDAKVLNDKGVMMHTLTSEQRDLTRSLPTMTEIHNFFTRHRLELTARSLGRYREEFVREFYASYVATLISQIDRRAAPAKQAPLDHVQVCGIQVDISLLAIHRYLYGEVVDANRTPLTADFDYRWQIVEDGQFLREPSLKETTKR